MYCKAGMISDMPGTGIKKTQLPENREHKTETQSTIRSNIPDGMRYK